MMDANGAVKAFETPARERTGRADAPSADRIVQASRVGASAASGLAALVLATAAIGKALDPMEFMHSLRGIIGLNFYPPFWLLGTLIAGELALCAWLIARPRQRLPIGVSALTFTSFTAYHLLLGGPSERCGCLSWLTQNVSDEGAHALSLSLAAVPAAILAGSWGALTIAARRPAPFLDHGGRAPLSRARLLILASLVVVSGGALALFTRMVSERSLYGFGALWGSYEPLSPDSPSGGLALSVGAQVRSLIRKENPSLPAPESLARFCGELAEAQARGSFGLYDQAMARQGAALKSGHEYLKHWKPDSFCRWSEIAIGRMTCKPLTAGHEARPPALFGLDAGDLASTEGEPSYVAGSRDASWLKAEHAVAVTLPIAAQGERMLVTHVFVWLDEGSWMLRHYAILSTAEARRSLRHLIW